MKSQIARYIIGGAGTVGLYVGGVWLGTDVLGWPVRPTNAGFYILATIIAFTLNYFWVFLSTSSRGKALGLFLLLQAFGVLMNIGWVEAGLIFTRLYPWIIAASFFAIWPFLSFAIQKRYIFKQ